jgi:hypothetical protein
MRMVPRFIVVAFTVAVASVAGCSHKSEECKAVIDTIDDDDAALKGLNFEVDDYALLAKNVKAGADAVDKVAADLATKKVTDADLAKESGDYQAFAKDLAKEMRAYGELVQKLGDTMAKLAPMEKTLSSGLKKLNERCLVDAVANDCVAVRAVMKDAPDQDAFKFDKDLKEDAEAFSKFVAELRALNVTITDKQVKDDVEQVAKGLGALEEVMRGLSDLKPKLDANTAALMAVLAKEGPIERHINETCNAK